MRIDEIIPVVARVAAPIAGKIVSRVGNKMGKGPAKLPNTAINRKAQQATKIASQQLATKLLKPGQKLTIGGAEVTVDKVQGKEVTLADPKNKQGPKTVLQKTDPNITGAIQAMAGAQAPGGGARTQPARAAAVQKV